MSNSTALSSLSSNVEASSPAAPVATFTNTSPKSPHHPLGQSYTYLCSCECSNYTRAKDALTNSQTEELVHSIQFNLLLNEKNLSAVIRKLSSAPDHRPSAEVLGGFGVLVLTAVACGVVALDCSRYFSWLSRRKSLAVKVQPAT
ncbi:sushi von Willebrand factor type A EGF and pentraxin domain-containing protein 1 [Biomphalaria glabrata]|nr:hypothetical protein BgiMline_021500 [Biomphalaria glabrata]